MALPFVQRGGPALLLRRALGGCVHVHVLAHVDLYVAAGRGGGSAGWEMVDWLIERTGP